MITGTEKAQVKKQLREERKARKCKEGYDDALIVSGAKRLIQAAQECWWACQDKAQKSACETMICKVAASDPDSPLALDGRKDITVDHHARKKAKKFIERHKEISCPAPAAATADKK